MAATLIFFLVIQSIIFLLSAIHVMVTFLSPDPFGSAFLLGNLHFTGVLEAPSVNYSQAGP